MEKIKINNRVYYLYSENEDVPRGGDDLSFDIRKEHLRNNKGEIVPLMDAAAVEVWKKQTDAKDILIVVMYSGDYLSENIGHEVINLFKSDNGKHYIYVNPYGYISEEYYNKIGYVLLCQLEKENVLRVVAKAEGLTLIAKRESFDKKRPNEHIYPRTAALNKKYVGNNEITYGTVKLNEIFSDNDMLLTFQADSVIKAVRPYSIMVCLDGDSAADNKSEDNCCVISNTRIVKKIKDGKEVETYWQFGKQALHMYVPYNGESKSDYQDIRSVIIRPGLWNTESVGTMYEERGNLTRYSKDTFFSIIRKEYDEVSYSNMLVYYLEKYRELLNLFISKLIEIFVVPTPGKGQEIIVKREYRRIDILIQYQDITGKRCAIIIENKIKSDINKSQSDIERDGDCSQLDRYVSELMNNDKYSAEEIHPFILLPNYSSVDPSFFYPDGTPGKYNLIKYGELYNWFKDILCDSYWESDVLPAFRLQSKDIDDSNFRKMINRFAERINSIKLLNNQ